jgi:hypothetical protein
MEESSSVPHVAKNFDEDDTGSYNRNKKGGDWGGPMQWHVEEKGGFGWCVLWRGG